MKDYVGAIAAASYIKERVFTMNYNKKSVEDIDVAGKKVLVR